MKYRLLSYILLNVVCIRMSFSQNPADGTPPESNLPPPGNPLIPSTTNSEIRNPPTQVNPPPLAVNPSPLADVQTVNDLTTIIPNDEPTTNLVGENATQENTTEINFRMLVESLESNPEKDNATFKGGCKHPPETRGPSYAISCTGMSSCTLKCSDGYTLEDDIKEKEIFCFNRTWILEPCQPICNPPCFEGKCVKPNKCECEDDYTGPYCKIKKQKCNPIQNIGNLHGMVDLSEEEIKLECFPGYLSNINTTEIIHKCTKGIWTGYPELACYPQCVRESACELPLKCVAPDVCACTPNGAVYDQKSSECVSYEQATETIPLHLTLVGRTGHFDSFSHFHMLLIIYFSSNVL